MPDNPDSPDGADAQGPDGQGFMVYSVEGRRLAENQFRWRRLWLWTLVMPLVLFVGIGTLGSFDADGGRLAPGTQIHVPDGDLVPQDMVLPLPRGTDRIKAILWSPVGGGGRLVFRTGDDTVLLHADPLAPTPTPLSLPTDTTVVVRGQGEGTAAGVVYALHLPALGRTVVNRAFDGPPNRYRFRFVRADSEDDAAENAAETPKESSP